MLCDGMGGSGGVDCDGMEWVGMGWDGMGLGGVMVGNGMGWDGTGQGGIGWGGVAWNCMGCYGVIWNGMILGWIVLHGMGWYGMGWRKGGCVCGSERIARITKPDRRTILVACTYEDERVCKMLHPLCKPQILSDAPIPIPISIREKASRGLEPRSLDSESRVLTVTPRGHIT